MGYWISSRFESVKQYRNWKHKNIVLGIWSGIQSSLFADRKVNQLSRVDINNGHEPHNELIRTIREATTIDVSRAQGKGVLLDIDVAVNITSRCYFLPKLCVGVSAELNGFGGRINRIDKHNQSRQGYELWMEIFVVGALRKLPSSYFMLTE